MRVTIALMDSDFFIYLSNLNNWCVKSDTVKNLGGFLGAPAQTLGAPKKVRHTSETVQTDLEPWYLFSNDLHRKVAADSEKVWLVLIQTIWMIEYFLIPFIIITIISI